MRDYIVFGATAVAGIVLFLASDVLTLLPRRLAYALLGLILIGLMVYLALRA